MSRNDGGPAFPVSTSESSYTEYGPYGHQDGNTTWQFGGMSMRDYFAAKALQKIMDTTIPLADADGKRIKVRTPTICAALAYHWADAMLEARK